jgi:hypothetical protein
MRPDDRFGIRFVRLAQNSLALADDLVGAAGVKDLGREQADAAVLVVGVLYQGKKAWQRARASSIEPKRSGNSGLRKPTA